MKGKILLISQNFYPELGSAANRMKQLYKQFEKAGYEPLIVTTEPSYPNHALFEDDAYYDDSELNALEGYRIIRIRMHCQKQHSDLVHRLFYYIELMIKVRMYIGKLGDYANVYVSSPNIFLAWATLFFKRNKKAKYFLEIRDLWPDSFLCLKKIKVKFLLPLLKWLEKQMYQQADEIVVNNPYFQSYINTMLNENREMVYLPNAVSQTECLNPIKETMFSVVYTGNIGYAQNVDQLIDIARGLNEKGIHMTAIIYGVQADVFREAVKREHLSTIHLVPPMKRDACLKAISKHHVSLSILEPSDVFMNVMPGKIVDSICSGTPVVSNVGGYTGELINSQQLGFAKAGASTTEIIDYIEQIKMNPELLDHIISQTKNLRDKQFIWENNFPRLTGKLRGV
ncbi:glycosyltransferase family 4 protein [Staphylococcus agnetis]|uniref:Glycosyltransferase family 4 protein n=1 Tax=Staphylococcus agnetis TaxID=985762 RepID=A0ABD7TV35_9STAP|nr:glycosyltransferase family 4 protein [Staphylococcus agnetis]KFE41825.1 glycoside hydrolase family protein [Staphylococcus agnetis]NJH65912.1 glycosyltransferase [Staphylococcus agnetis]NJH98254.1 glycosyltransferase [Staphylococcus agnetis]PTH49111.1 glycosyltransferase WbuB [Staphylococcus agnetis]PTH73654.1 glycosyltransferase WbuB [Staphylococcus agnetis]